MSKHTIKVCALPGDGIGPEIVAEAEKVLQKACHKYDIALCFDRQYIGGIAIDTVGESLPQQTLQACKNSDSVLLGAVGGPKWDALEGDKRPEAGLLAIRSALGLYANIRPARIFEPLKNASPLKNEIIQNGIDIVVVRELTGGIYFGEKGRRQIQNRKYAYDIEQYSEEEVFRIARVAFETAAKRGKKVCSVDKANVLESSRLWRACVTELAKEYPHISLEHMYVDNAAMQLVRNPGQFDVILTSNIFGDILSDEASMISGSIGMLASASIGDSSLGLYEPIHGSAPDIAGKNIANPLATILSTAMMMRYSLNQNVVAQEIEQAVEKAIAVARTADIASPPLPTIGTCEMGDLVCSFI